MRKSLIALCFVFSSPLVVADFTAWDPSPEVVAGQAQFSNNNLSISPSFPEIVGAVGVISQHSVSSGKHYFETTTDCGPDTLGYSVGVATSNPLLPSRPFLWTKGWGLLSDGLGILNKSIRFPKGFQPTLAGDTFMVALDADSGEVYFGKNGEWLEGADPASGLNPSFSNLPANLYAALEVGSRQCRAPLMTVATNFGDRPFKYEVPEGYFKGFCADGNCPKAGAVEVDLTVNNKNQNCSKANNKARKVTVAFYGSPEFDVANLDSDSVSISGMKIAGQGFDDGSCRAEYLNDDSYLDASCDLDSSSLKVSFEGLTVGGDELFGNSAVCLK